MPRDPRQARLSAAAGALLLILLLGACGPQRVPSPRHVILITVDTLRSDHMSAYGYPRLTSPSFDALAGSGVLFERAVVQWPKTGTSLASLFIGQYPQTTGITHEASVRLPAGYLTLPEFFQRNGFRTVAVVSNAVLSTGLGWASGFDEYIETWGDDRLPEEPGAFRKLINARRVNELALPLLDENADAERLFVWLHYCDPHAPYILPEGFENPFLGDIYYRGDEKVQPEMLDDRHGIAGHQELKYYVAQYDANILVVDRAIQEVIDRTRSLGLLDDALVVVTADHGESLGEHDLYLRHGSLPYNTTSNVPLLLYYPGFLRPRRVAQPVELVDLYPTLRDLVAPGQEIPGLEGDSLVPWLTGGDDGGEQDSATRYAFAQAGDMHPRRHFRTVQDTRWKLVYHPDRRVGGQLVPALYELYDLEEDPLETTNLAEQKPEQLRRLRSELFGWMNGDWLLYPRGQVEEKSEEALEALRALGYIE